MIEIKLHMNTSVEEVLAFKTCCGLKVTDQNLEIHITNNGDSPVFIHSYMDLVGSHGTKRIQNLMPQGELSVTPGQIKAFYCNLDPELWDTSDEVALFDTSGKRHTAKVHRDKQPD